MKLSDLYENPDNPSVATDEEINRLKGKLERVPRGLTAMRIAYVTDKIEGKKMVISGNKRLRVLKEQFGEDAELPDEYFQDVTSMSEAERHEFIVTANISDGHWDMDKLLAQYDVSFLKDISDSSLMALVNACPNTDFDSLSSVFSTDETKPDQPTKNTKTMTCPHCGKTIEI